jgi:A/G-specific adenine glycosylase
LSTGSQGSTRAPGTASAYRAPDVSHASQPASPLSPGATDAVTAWFDRAARDLPWRTPDASDWSIVVSEIMLQQTPVVRVLPRWQEWMRRWPTPADLAAAPTAQVLQVWDRLGYPRRALRLQECARTITQRHGGRVPHGVQELRALPGIGEYTAAAVTAFAHHDHAVVADTNVRRVLVRAVWGHAQPGSTYTAAQRALATSCVPQDREASVRWNQAVMELGALVCTSRSPRCEDCPLRSHGCRWWELGRPQDTGTPRRRQAFEGTDRQLRGKIMALLRQEPTSRSRIDALDPADPVRVQRCLDSLLADGLAVEDEGPRADRDETVLRLP